MKSIIGLLTDFGLTDPYVAEMKAVILTICPEATIVDISHLVEKFNIRRGAFLLASAAPAFPDGSIFVAVVDPGVGGKRRPIVIETGTGRYVGPDNGLMILAAQRDKIRGVYEITNRSLMQPEVSSTFHGRDVFAPVAAHLSCGVAVQDCGPTVSDYFAPSYSQPKLDKNWVRCEILHIDGFGNVITNLRDSDSARSKLRSTQKVRLVLGSRRLSADRVMTYSDIGKNGFGILIGSHGFWEIACREGSAAKRIRARTGMPVQISSA